MNKKGFTLIELLAVIVLLALIALIATPIIVKVIKSSKETANRTSIDGLYNAIQVYYSDTMNFSGTSKFIYKNNSLTCTENCGSEKNISVRGTMGGDATGWGYIDRDNTKVAVYKDDKCYYKINGSNVETKKMSQNECQNLANG